MENLNGLSLEELEANEISNTLGGTFVKYTPLGFGIWMGYEIISNWSDVKSGIIDGYNDAINAISN